MILHLELPIQNLEISSATVVKFNQGTIPLRIMSQSKLITRSYTILLPILFLETVLHIAASKR